MIYVLLMLTLNSLYLLKISIVNSIDLHAS